MAHRGSRVAQERRRPMGAARGGCVVTLMFAISTDRNDFTWTPFIARSPWQWAACWLCFEVRFAK
jgi:hypothetical protein